LDVLNDILDTLNLKGVLYFRTDFSPPWAVSVPEFEQAARFHLVVQGSCHVIFPSGRAVHLAAGDLILIPAGKSHVLADTAVADAPPLEATLKRVGYTGNGVFVLGEGDAAASTQMICGHFTFRENADHPLLRALPEYILTTSSARARGPWLDEMLRLLTTQMFTEEIGSVAAVTRLSEIVFIELLRIGIAHSEALRTVMEAFRDKHISRALQLVHSRPEEPWTVESLAREIGMSRSRFAERFSQLMRLGPMTYLTDWRLQRALSLLEKNSITVQQVAAQIGYQSPAAFTRAFTEKFGISPIKYRHKSI
jgi:AraC family transcriptional regulator, activator of mtrCDE